MTRTRTAIETQPPQHRDRVQDRLSRSGCLIRIADDCRGVILRGEGDEAGNIIAARDSRMADTKRLIELAAPLKQQIESAVAAGKPVSGIRWRRLSRYLRKLSDNLSDMAALERMRKEAANEE